VPEIVGRHVTPMHDEAFELSEASVRLEGIDPMAYPEYVALRTRVITGEITTEQAVQLLAARYKKTQLTAA
jgi:hypothetical protein